MLSVRSFALLAVFCALATLLGGAITVAPAGATVYYVSSDTGSDVDDGLTPSDAFASLAHVNTLALQPGDEVRLLCGETWVVD